MPDLMSILLKRCSMLVPWSPGEKSLEEEEAEGSLDAKEKDRSDSDWDELNEWPCVKGVLGGPGLNCSLSFFVNCLYHFLSSSFCDIGFGDYSPLAKAPFSSLTTNLDKPLRRTKGVVICLETLKHLGTRGGRSIDRSSNHPSKPFDLRLRQIPSLPPFTRRNTNRRANAR